MESRPSFAKRNSIERNTDAISRIESMEKNFERAAELVDVPDDVILKMYDKLRPNRSTKLELVLMAQELLEKYNAKNCARLVMEAAEVYEKRGILL